MRTSTVPLRANARKSHTASKSIQDEMQVQAVSHLLWVALYEAERAGLDDVVDGVGRLHRQVVQRLHRLREVA